MNITYIGHSSFKIRTINATLITDPFDSSIGKRFPKSEADIVSISHDHKDHSNREGIKNENCFFIDAPGEYEIKEVMIRAISTFHDNDQGQDRGKNIIFRIQAEGLNICHLGDLGHELSDKILKEIEATDVLMIPVGGVYTIDPSEAAKIVRKIEPSIVLPMHYKQEGLSATFAQLASLSDFANKLDLEPKQEDKLSIREGTLPDEMELIALNPRA
jgi:L-ascorbate metabolism protein UlaG (beta-lactamase superfamily)